MDDTEQVLQTALRERAALVTPDNLEYQRLPESSAAPHRSPERRRMMFPAIAAAMVVALVAIGVSVLRGSNDSHKPQPGGAYVTEPFYIGEQWRLVTVRHGGQRVQIPAAVGADAEFLTTGELHASDGVNALSGRYRPSAGGFLVSNAGTTFAAYAGSDPAKKAAIAALAAVVFGLNPSSTVSRPSHVQVTRDAANLVLDAGGYQLTFTSSGRPGPEPTEQASTRT